MRHRVKGFKIGRTASHRKATLRALSTALIRHKKIRTTITKAKATQLFVEPIITKAKNDTVHSRRLVSRDIQDRKVLIELFSDVAEKVANRNGGYTRIVKLGTRPGDAAEMAIIELVDYNLGNEVVEKPAKISKPKVEDKVEEAVVTEESTVEEVTEESTEEVAEETSEEVKEEKAEDSEEETKENK